MTHLSPQVPTPDDHQKAFTEVAFLIDIFTSTIDNIMGGATASVGRIAGRSTAKKLPLNLDHPPLKQTLDVVIERMKNGYEITYSERKNDVDLTFKKCIIRDVCRKRKLEPGAPLCKLFHFYFDGVVNNILGRPVKSDVLSTKDVCTLCMKIQ